MYYGMDVSDWQGAINWKTIATENSLPIHFVYSKATDGILGSQQYFANNHDSCNMLDIPFGAYHFFRFGEDPVAQAQNFIKTTIAVGRAGPLLPMVDVEVGEGNVSELSTFLQTIEKAFKIEHALIYTDAGYWDGSGLGDGFAGHPLWIANFIHDGNLPAGQPYLPQSGGWKSWTVFQYDNEGSIPGVGNVDLDETASIDAIRRPL